MEKTFNLQEALKRAPVQTKAGNKALVICQTRGKILVKVYSKLASYLDKEVKYNLDGTRWSPKNPSDEDLIMA